MCVTKKTFELDIHHRQPPIFLRRSGKYFPWFLNRLIVGQMGERTTSTTTTTRGTGTLVVVVALGRGVGQIVLYFYSFAVIFPQHTERKNWAWRRFETNIGAFLCVCVRAAQQTNTLSLPSALTAFTTISNIRALHVQRDLLDVKEKENGSEATYKFCSSKRF